MTQKTELSPGISNFDQFVPLAIRTESKFETVQFNPIAFKAILTACIAAGNLMDFVKKGVAYNKPIDFEKFGNFVADLNGAVVDLMCLPTEKYEEKETIGLNSRLFHGITGIVTEGAELLEAMQQALDSGNWDDTNLVEEIGDIAWYEAILLDELDEKFYPILSKIIAKLRVRYPEKYTDANAIDRNLTLERQILEA